MHLWTEDNQRKLEQFLLLLMPGVRLMLCVTQRLFPSFLYSFVLHCTDLSWIRIGNCYCTYLTETKKHAFRSQSSVHCRGIRGLYKTFLCSYDHPGTISVASPCLQNRKLLSFAVPRGSVPRQSPLWGILGGMRQTISVAPGKLLEMGHTQVPGAFSSWENESLLSRLHWWLLQQPERPTLKAFFHPPVAYKISFCTTLE